MKHLRYATALVVTLALGVTGCGGDEGGSGSDGQPAGKEIAAGKATGQITVWAMGAESEKLNALAADFTKENPEAKVNVTSFPFDAAHDKIATAIAGRQTPDISMVGTTWMGEFAKTGAFDPAPTGLFDKSKFFAGAWNSAVVDGTAYGVPWYVETRLIYHRSDLAATAGQQKPTNWQGLTDFATAMKDKGGAKWGIYLQPGGTASWQTFMPFAWQAGADIMKDGKFTLDTPEMRKALEYYASFFKQGLAPTNLAPEAVGSGFIKGEVGAFVSGPWHMGILRGEGGPAFEGKWDVAQMPREQAGTSFIGGSDLAVFKDSRNRDTAWKFVQFLTTPAAQQKLYDLVGSLPALQETWQSGKLADDPFLQAFGEQLKDAKSAPAIATWEQVADVIDDGIERVVRGVTDPATAAKEMQSKASSIGTGS
ncbi:sugar ABC transporter substrate-binding protein [Micromonospora sp. DR5-3]|uniref:sugar ABC transporter substrate-binding protein n=1 Tax=unclassified Micromonospora TaxID=2617518 RepID=UPI0011D819E1|nr:MULTISPECIES: sugar ABC transporter substrate-binding protein [unclassified Micromonospora]MCW3814029.1 sugar ABC transporter substrate-binding protein [Micromonospora sp. DR5-3]TYC23618.1 sugar ABC transporter substrate-binding protein [Micromonospora sp. MP36]